MASFASAWDDVEEEGVDDEEEGWLEDENVKITGTRDLRLCTAVSQHRKALRRSGTHDKVWAGSVA